MVPCHAERLRLADELIVYIIQPAVLRVDDGGFRLQIGPEGSEGVVAVAGEGPTSGRFFVAVQVDVVAGFAPAEAFLRQPAVDVEHDFGGVGQLVVFQIGNVMETAGWTFTLGVLALIVASVFKFFQ